VPTRDTQQNHSYKSKHRLEIAMHFSSVVFLSLSAGALAHPLIGSNVPSSLEKRAHSGWMASYPIDDPKCTGRDKKHGGYINGTDDQHRPTLGYVPGSNRDPRLTTFEAVTDNIGVYCGSGDGYHAFRRFDLWQGKGRVPGPDLYVTHTIECTPGAYPGACFSAKAMGYPWAFVSIHNTTEADGMHDTT